MGESIAEPSSHNSTLLYCTLLGFAVISWLLWKFVLSPPNRPAAAARASTTNAASSGSGVATNNANNDGGTTSTAARATATRSSSSRTAAASAKSGAGDKDDDEETFGKHRHPPHYNPPENWSAKKTDVSGCLVHGIVPFRSTFASGYETRLQKDTNPLSDMIVANRRERARIFARMFSAQNKGGAAARPPNRGANIVITIRHGDVSCQKLQKALYLLGTYYNLFILVDGSNADAGDNDEERRDFMKRLRARLLNDEGSQEEEEEEEEEEEDSTNNNYKLNQKILPRHRIVFTSTNSGRVAFVRQLSGTELVVDCEESVTKELERFGFRALLYTSKEGSSTNGEDEGATSPLGKFLIP